MAEVMDEISSYGYLRQHKPQRKQPSGNLNLRWEQKFETTFTFQVKNWW